MERFLRIALLLCDQATVVDLGTGRYLLALLSGNGEAFACRVFQDRLTDAPTDKARALSKLCDTAPVPLKALPMLVTFGDIADPTSVRQVAPDDLAASFGQGYALREVTLEITDAPVTTGVVEGVLGWLAGLDGGLLDGLRLVRSPLKTGWQMIYLAEVLFATALFRSNSCLFSRDLFLSLLATDADNRGYKSGLAYHVGAGTDGMPADGMPITSAA